MWRKLGRRLFLSPVLLLFIGMIVGIVYLISMFTGFNPLASLFANVQSRWPVMNVTISIIFPAFVVGILILATTPGENAPVFTVKWSIRQWWKLSKPYILNFFLITLFFGSIQWATFLLSFIIPIIPNILMSFIWIRIFLAYQKMALSASRQLPFVFKNIFISPKKIFFFLIANAISFLYIAFWLALFIIPGIRWSMRLSMIAFCILDQDIGPFAAIKASRRMTKWFVADLYLFLLMGWVIIGAWALVFGIGLLRALPTYLVAQAYIYNRILAAYTSKQVQQPQPQMQQQQIQQPQQLQ